jgi:hypothetical protein
MLLENFTHALKVQEDSWYVAAPEKDIIDYSAGTGHDLCLTNKNFLGCCGDDDVRVVEDVQTLEEF